MQARKQRPNVLLVLSDQHKRSCMGAYGDPIARTPNLDKLAAKSVRFTNAYCSNPVCTPSRASLLTGLYCHHLESQSNTTPFLPVHKTIAHHFSAAGYVTGLIGKMHFVDGQTHGFDYKLDFNEWFQYLGPKTKIYADELGQPNSGSGLPQIDDLWRDEGDPWKGIRQPDGRKGAVSGGRISLLEEKDHFESFVARESVRFLRNFAKSGQPMLLVTSFLKPHDPFMPAKRFADLFRPEDMHLPESYGKADLERLPREVVRNIQNNAVTPEFKDRDEALRHIAFYYANLAQMDDCLGQIIRAVQELGLENDTIICYTSDHGEMLGDLGLWQKFQFYEGSCGVPLLISVPGRAPGVCPAPVSLVSLSATLTQLAGVTQLTPNDSKSLVPWIENPRTEKDPGPVFAQYALGGRNAKAMVRVGRWKYTAWANDIPELYDLESDPAELHNLAGQPQHAAVEADMMQRLNAFHPVA